MKHTMTFVVLIALSLFVSSPVRADKPSGKTESLKIKIDNFNFNPATLTVRPGTTVTWVNQDDVPHTVTSTDKKFDSKVLDTDEKFSFTFTDRGSYNYFCKVHPHMTGKILVQ